MSDWEPEPGWGRGVTREGVSHRCASSPGPFDGRERQRGSQGCRVMGGN